MILNFFMLPPALLFTWAMFVGAVSVVGLTGYGVFAAARAAYHWLY